MDAGRELDALVAEKVMGYIPSIPPDPEGMLRPGKEYPVVAPHYSTDIAAAWPLADIIRKRWPAFQLHADAVYGWRFSSDDDYVSYDGSVIPDAEVYHDSMPLLLCLAALKAVGVSV